MLYSRREEIIAIFPSLSKGGFRGKTPTYLPRKFLTGLESVLWRISLHLSKEDFGAKHVPTWRKNLRIFLFTNQRHFFERNAYLAFIKILIGYNQSLLPTMLQRISLHLSKEDFPAKPEHANRKIFRSFIPLYLVKEDFRRKRRYRIKFFLKSGRKTSRAGVS